MATAELHVPLPERRLDLRPKRLRLLEQLEAYLRDRKARGYALPQGVVDLLDELERV